MTTEEEAAFAIIAGLTELEGIFDYIKEVEGTERMTAAERRICALEDALTLAETRYAALERRHTRFVLESVADKLRMRREGPDAR